MFEKLLLQMLCMHIVLFLWTPEYPAREESFQWIPLQSAAQKKCPKSLEIVAALEQVLINVGVGRQF